MTLRFCSLRAALLALAASGFCLAATPGEAATRKATGHGKHGAKSEQAANAHPAEAKAPAEPAPRSERTGVWTSGEQDRACFRGRRKLWDGQGWVVKRVNICP